MWEQISGTRGDSWLCHWCSYHILTSSVICYWTDLRQHGIYLFYIIKNNRKSFFILKSFSITWKPAFAHFGEHEKKPFDVIHCLYKMKQSHRLLCVAKNCDLSRKITPLSNLSWKSLLVDLKLTAKAELNCKIYKSEWKFWKVKSSLVSRKYLWQEMKNTLRKLAVAVNTGGHSIRVLNERNVRPSSYVAFLPCRIQFN